MPQQGGKKRYFELFVEDWFDERLLVKCFKDVATDNGLRSAVLKWYDKKHLMICCSAPVHINILIDALDSEQARQIVWVHDIVTADLGSRRETA